MGKDLFTNYTENDKKAIINDAYILLCRILKENNHFAQYREAYFAVFNQSNLLDRHCVSYRHNYLKLPPEECLYQIFLKEKYCVGSWCVHKNIEWNSQDEWENGFDYEERCKYTTPNIYVYIIIVVGMQLNLFGSYGFNCGFFYDDFQIFKKKITEEKIS